MSTPKGFTMYKAVVHSADAATGYSLVHIPALTGGETIPIPPLGLPTISGQYALPSPGDIRFVAVDTAGTQYHWVVGADSTAIAAALGVTIDDVADVVAAVADLQGDLAGLVVTSAMIQNDTIVDADINSAAGIVDTKLATISTANKVSATAIDIDGATDIGTALADADLILVDDGAGGTNRKSVLSRVATWLFAKFSGDATANSTGTVTIANDAVTNAKMANMTSGTIKMRGSGGTGDPEDVAYNTFKGYITVGGSYLTGTLDSITMVAGSIQTADIADSAITSNKILANTIQNVDIATNQVMTNIKAINRDDYCGRAIRNAAQTIGTGAGSILIGNTELYDYNNMHNTSNGHITIPIAGVYAFTANLTWTVGSATGYRTTEIRRYNAGGTLQEIVAVSTCSAGDNTTDYTQNSAAGECLCASGDIIRVHAIQNSGGNIDVATGLGITSGYTWHAVYFT